MSIQSNASEGWSVALKSCFPRYVSGLRMETFSLHRLNYYCFRGTTAVGSFVLSALIDGMERLRRRMAIKIAISQCTRKRGEKECLHARQADHQQSPHVRLQVDEDMKRSSS